MPKNQTEKYYDVLLVQRYIGPFKLCRSLMDFIYLVHTGMYIVGETRGLWGMGWQGPWRWGCCFVAAIDRTVILTVKMAFLLLLLY